MNETHRNKGVLEPNKYLNVKSRQWPGTGTTRTKILCLEPKTVFKDNSHFPQMFVSLSLKPEDHSFCKRSPDILFWYIQMILYQGYGQTTPRNPLQFYSFVASCINISLLSIFCKIRRIFPNIKQLFWPSQPKVII